MSDKSLSGVMLLNPNNFSILLGDRKFLRADAANTLPFLIDRSTYCALKAELVESKDASNFGGGGIFDLVRA